MARYCPCDNIIPLNVVIEGKVRNLQNRKFCLACSPFGNHNTRDLFRTEKPVSTEKFRRYQQKERRARKDALIQMLGGKCEMCGYNRCNAALEFHHRDPETKTLDLGLYLLRRWEVVLAEAQKCALLCADCHRELEDGLRQERGEEWDGDDDTDAPDEHILREAFAPHYLAA